MRQTKLGSFYEACINVAIGFGINFVANLVILPLFGFDITLTDNLYIGLLYTIVSVVRSYVVRRWFDRRIHEAAQKISTIKENIMSQRTQVAATILNGICAGDWKFDIKDKYWDELAVDRAIELADLLLTKLDETDELH